MKSPLVFRRRAAVLAALALAPLSFSTPLRAQEAPPPAAEGTPSLPGDQLMDIAFERSSAEEIAAFLEKRSKTPVSVILKGDITARVIPAMKLKNVSLADFIKVLNQLGENGELASYSVRDVPGVSGIYIFEMTVNRPIQDSATPPAPTVFLDLADVLTEKLTINDVTTAIQTAWGTRNSDADAEALKFHEETKLLVVNAPEARIATAQSLVMLLQNRAKAERENSSYREIEGLYRKVDQAQQERTRISQELDEERAIGKKNQAEAQARITELEIEVAKLSEALKSAK